MALESFDNVAISLSGAEDVVLVDVASRIQAGTILEYARDIQSGYASR